MFYASPGAWGGDTGFPPSSVCSFYKSYPHGKSLPFGFWAVCLNVSFWHVVYTFPRGVNPKATLGRFHPKAILGSELREGGSCALPLLASCLDAMLYFLFIPFPFNSSSFEMVFGPKKMWICLKVGTLLLRFLISGVEVQCCGST